MQRIEYARRQSLDARQKAAECIDNRTRDEWLKAAEMWDALAVQYERLLADETQQMVNEMVPKAPARTP